MSPASRVGCPRAAMRRAMMPAGRFHSVFGIVLAAAMLLWPAYWNGYPLVFSDTGTYLSQAIHCYLGWDRPAVYSLLLYPFHMQRNLWPPVLAQALFAAWMLHLLRRTLLEDAAPWVLPALALALAACTAMPWGVAQLLPDGFTAPLALALALTVLTPERLSRTEAALLFAAIAGMIAAHQSHIPLALLLLAVLTPLRGVLGAAPLGGRAWRWLAWGPLPAACLALVAMNAAGHGRFSVSPFGNVFLLARVIYDGPGMAVLKARCPAAGWRLCAQLGRFPPTSDDFLWRADSPLALAGGAKLVSPEADAIIRAAVLAEPGRELRAFLANVAEQLTRFDTGDGLEAWPRTVTPWIERDFPPGELARYAAARQTMGVLGVPAPLAALHRIAALAGLAGCAAVLARGLRRRHVAAGFAAAALLAVLANAAITGGLSVPHDRYQSRIVWLPLLVTLFAAPGVFMLRAPAASEPRADTSMAAGAGTAGR